MDEMLGNYNYQLRLLCENDCSIRNRKVADSEMEFHHGTYNEFNEEDWSIPKTNRMSI